MKEIGLINREAALACFHDWIDKNGDIHTPDEMAEYRAIERLPSVGNLSREVKNVNQELENSNDCISRQAAIDAMAELQGRASTKAELKGISKAWKRIKQLPSVQPELPPYVAEIEAEYRKAVKAPCIRKPLAKALYEVWKKHDREDAERRTDEQTD